MNERMGKDGIEYADLSINFFSGCKNIELGNCKLGKDCWAFVMSKRLAGRFGYSKSKPFSPTFHPNMFKRVIENKRPIRYATNFMGDTSYAKIEWMRKILGVVEQCPQHRFYFLTKHPDKLQDYEFPDNAWVGVTVNEMADEWRIEELKKIKAKVKFISFEPIYEQLDIELDMLRDNVSWVVIGAKTGRHPEQPKRKWVTKLIIKAKFLKIPVFLKPNLEGYEELIQEFPDVDGGKFA